MIKVGRVVAVDEKKAKVRVQLLDNDAMVTYWLSVVVQKSQDDKFYWVPDIGELVVCAFFEHGIEDGFVLGAIYNEQDSPPVQDRDKFYIRFKDGTKIEYDRKEHKLRAVVQGDVEIKATGTFKVIGNLLVEGNIHATGSIIDEGGNTNHHSH